MKNHLKLFAMLAAAGMTVNSPVAQAAIWSDTFIGYRYGADFHDPNNTNDLEKHSLQFTYASGYSVGQNFVTLNILQSDSNDPANGSDNGATEFYLTYRHQLHLGKAFDKNLAFGPVKEVAFTAGFDLNTKNTRFAPHPVTNSIADHVSAWDFKSLMRRLKNATGLDLKNLQNYALII